MQVVDKIRNLTPEQFEHLRAWLDNPEQKLISYPIHSKSNTSPGVWIVGGILFFLAQQYLNASVNRPNLPISKSQLICYLNESDAFKTVANELFCINPNYVPASSVNPSQLWNPSNSLREIASLCSSLTNTVHRE